MKVYCTRPRQPNEMPHLTSIDDALLAHADRRSTGIQNCECRICGMPLILGQGRYLPIEALGQGGFGYTFLAWDLRFPHDDGTYDTRVIKQFRSDRLLLPGQVESALHSFEQEGQILNKLKHPQIPRVYEPFKVQAGPDTYAYFVQEHVLGKDLEVELTGRTATNQPWTEPEISGLLKQLLEILHYIHTAFAAPIVHRDIKPSNIIHDHQGRYYLIDFGSVKQVIAAIESNFSRPETQHVISAGYSPPEQHCGSVDCSSDLYALGKTCIYLLTGSQYTAIPWKQGTPIRSKLMAVLRQMTEFDPEKRYRSASEVLMQLDEQGHQPSTSHDREKKWLMLGGVLLSLSGLGLGYVAYDRHNDDRHKMTIPSRNYQQSLSNIASVTELPSGEFKYGGSTTWIELSSRMNPIIQQAFPHFILRPQAPPPGQWWHSEAGIDMLIERQLDFALSSKGIPEEQSKRARSMNIKLKEIPIAISSTAIIVHPDLAVDGITTSEFGLIKKGDITNWQSLGGPNLPLTIYQTNKMYLDGAKFVTVKNATDAHGRIAQDRGGLTISPAAVGVLQCQVKALRIGGDRGQLRHPYVQPSVSQSDCLAGRKNKINLKVIEDSSYPLLSKLSIIVIENGQREQWIGESYAYMLKTTEAQNQIRAAGYDPIK